MRYLGITLVVLIGTALTIMGMIYGNRIHKEITPGIEGQLEGYVQVDGHTDVLDRYIIDESKKVTLRRFFTIEETGDTVEIRVVGKYRERYGSYRLRFRINESEYVSKAVFSNDKGRTIKPQKLIDKVVIIPKSGITDKSMVIEVKRKNDSGKGKSSNTTYQLQRN